MLVAPTVADQFFDGPDAPSFRHGLTYAGHATACVVAEANLDILDIDHILLSGGTAHTPKIASNLRAHFPDSTTVTAPSTSASSAWLWG